MLRDPLLLLISLNQFSDRPVTTAYSLQGKELRKKHNKNTCVASDLVTLAFRDLGLTTSKYS